MKCNNAFKNTQLKSCILELDTNVLAQLSS